MKQSGFTLIELLVAITILSIVAVLGWRGLDAIVRARVSLTQDLEQTRGIQLAFAQMQSDCARILQPADIGGNPTLSLQGGNVIMVRTVFAEDQPSRVQVVVYRLRDGQLTRSESNATRDLNELNSMWQAAQGGAGQEQNVVLQSNVASLTARTWFSAAPGWRAADAPPPATTPGVTLMPIGLQISMQLRGSEQGMNKVFLLGAV